MRDTLLDCKDELKRAEHLVFVSMKYSRTVDVIRSIIQRLISVHQIMIDALLTYKQEEGEDFELPKTYGLKTQLIRKYFKDDKEVIDDLEFYFYLMKLLRADFESFNEYRRHVNMLADLDGKKVMIDYDLILEYYKRSVKFFNYLIKTYLNEDYLADY